MFNKSNEPQQTAASQPQAAGDPGKTTAKATGKTPGMPSIISADLKVVGDLQCVGDIQIEGRVEGDIKSETVTVGEGAEVSGSIYANTVRVSGSVKGQIEANAVVLAKSAKVSGDVIHETLSIEAGAQLEGNCRRIQSAKAAVGETKVSELKPPVRESAGIPPGGPSGSVAKPVAN